jgi:protein-disulfide isomerase
MTSSGRQILAGVIGLVAGAAAMAALGNGAPSAAEPGRAQIEAIVRDYILANPEIIPEAMRRLQGREVTKTISSHRAALEKSFAGGWIGAADADVVLVEFFDYACGFCRASVADIDRLVAEDKKLKVVFRELPILGEGSDAAARASLAAAKQNRFIDFHRRMYAAGAPDAAEAQQVQKTVGLDVARAARDSRGTDVAGEIDRNIELARVLGVTGTPTFIVGDRLLSGAVGYAALKDAIAEARKAK